MPTPVTRLSALPAVLLVGVAIWELVATRTQATALPTDADWAAAASYVRREYKPGDLIVFAPAWADPIGRLHLGDLIPLEMAGRMDADRYGRIWEVAIGEARAPETIGLTPVAIAPWPVEVRRYERTPVQVVSELTSARGARVDLVEVAFEPHRCIVLSVPPAGTRFVAKDLALGSDFVGYVGIADIFTRRDERSPVRLELEIDGVWQTEVIAPIDRWVRFRAATKPGVSDVGFTLWWDGPEDAPPKKVCIAAEARR